jgi:hypothetical protein
MTATAQKPIGHRLSKTQDPAAELARAAASGTQLHGKLLEALKGLGNEELPPAQHRVRRDAYLVIACAALRVLADLVTVQALKLEVPDAVELLELARHGLHAESGRSADDAAYAFLMVDWLGTDRFAYIMHFYEAADRLKAANKAQAKSDQAIAKLRKIAERAGAPPAGSESA